MMNRRALFVAVIALLMVSAAIAQEFEVSNVRSSQQEYPGMMVDVYYDLTGEEGVEVNVTLLISTDGGLTFSGPMESVTGDIGEGIAPGVDLHITWDAGVEMPGVYNDDTIARVFAEVPPEGPEEQDFELGDTGEMITMVWIPAGEFMMGAQDGEQDAGNDEYPRHPVTIEEGFWMGKYEVTQAQWEAIAGDWEFNFDGNPNRPAEMVSWNDIHNDFLPEINATEQGDPWGLPSEAQWEYACRAGTTTRFYWGDDPNYPDIDDYAVYSDNDSGGTAEVGTKLPNGWGLYDMSGNVWEWCEDDYHNNYNGAPDNQTPWIDNPRGDDRVERGGGWNFYAGRCRSAVRGSSAPAARYNYFGLRLVRSEP